MYTRKETETVKSILQQIDQFITDNASYIKDCWRNTLYDDYPFYIPAYSYDEFFKQIERVLWFYLSYSHDNAIIHHDIIEINTEADHAILIHYNKSEGDDAMTAWDADDPQLTWEIGIHKLSIVII